MTKQTQTAIIYDLISEGEVKGLVYGEASVYLDGTPIIDSEERESLGPVSGSATISGAPYTTVTFNPESGFDLTELDLTQSSRVVTFERAITISNCYVYTNKHRRVLYTPNHTWASSDVGKLITITGGPNGESYKRKISALGAVSSGANSRVQVDSPLPGPVGAGNPRTVYVQETRTIASVSNSTTLVLASGTTNALTNSPAVILPVGSSTSSVLIGKRNFETAGVMFRVGSREQSIADTTIGGTGTSFASKFNDEIKQSSRTLASFSPGTISGQDPTIKTASTSMGIADAGSIDYLKVVLQFPSMIRYQIDGDKLANSVEFQIFFEYKRGEIWYNSDGTIANSSNSVPVFGVSDDEIETRPAKSLKDSTVLEEQVDKWAIAQGQTNSGVVTTKSTSEFIKEFGFAVEKFQPFDDFRIRIKRVTGDEISIRDSTNSQHQSYYRLYSLIIMIN